MNWIIALVVGLVAGANIGFVVYALAAAAGRNKDIPCRKPDVQ